MKCTDKSSRLKSIPAVEHAQFDSLLHVLLTVVAGRQVNQMLALYALGLFQLTVLSEQARGFADVGKVANKAVHISVETLHQGSSR